MGRGLSELPGTHETIRGFSAVSLILIDEASRVHDDVYDALRPMLAVENGDLWMMSTPAGQHGFFYQTWAGNEEWFRMSVKATECPRIRAEFLEGERSGMTSSVFEQEYMCCFHGDGTEYFDRQTVLDAVDLSIPELRFSSCSMYYLGLDLGQKRDYSAVAVVERIDRFGERLWGVRLSELVVRYAERLPLGTPYPRAVERVRAIVQSGALAGNCALAVDATGVGAPVVDMLRAGAVVV